MRPTTSVVTLAVGLLLAAGCSGESSEPVIESGKDAQSQRTEDPTRNCDVQGINSERGKEGSCLEDGIVYTVVDRESKLRLPELDVRLVETNTTAAHPDGGNPANGLYVIFTVEITNRTSEPESLRADQAFLALNGEGYSRDTDAELSLNAYPELDDLQPGKARTGRLIFEIPAPTARALRVRAVGANLTLVQFSESDQLPRPKRLGQIRLYE